MCVGRGGVLSKTHSNPDRKPQKHVVYFRLIKSFGEPVTEIGEINRIGEKKSVE